MEWGSYYLWMSGSGVVKSGSGVSEVLSAHQIVSLQCSVNIITVNTKGYPHDHVLWTFNYFTVYTL